MSVFKYKLVYDRPQSFIHQIINLLANHQDLGYTWVADTENFYGQYYEMKFENKTKVYEYLTQSSSLICNSD